MKSDVELNAQAEADQFRATISQALVVGGTSTTALTDADQKSTLREGGQPDGFRAVDTALESWDQPAGYDVSMPRTPTRPMVAGATL